MEDEFRPGWCYPYLYGGYILVSIVILSFSYAPLRPFGYCGYLLFLIALYGVYIFINHRIIKRYIPLKEIVVFESLLLISLIWYAFATVAWWDKNDNSVIISAILRVLKVVCMTPLDFLMELTSKI